MLRRFLGTAILLPILGLLVYTVLNPGAQASPNELIIVTKTRGHEEVKATLVDGQVKFRLKNNHSATITSFAINVGDTTIKEDFAYSEVHLGIESGDTFEKSYPLSPSVVGSEPPTLYLLTVLLTDQTQDGDSNIAQEIKDERLGEKIQILRTLRILEKERISLSNLGKVKVDLGLALNTDDSQTRIALSELQPSTRSDIKPSDDLRNGLHVGREKMLHRFELIEQLSPADRENGIFEFKERANKLFAKL